MFTCATQGAKSDQQISVLAKNCDSFFSRFCQLTQLNGNGSVGLVTLMRLRENPTLAFRCFLRPSATGTGEARRGFVEVVKELETRFPDPASIEKEADKKAFAKLFGEYLRIENILQNYD
jgi:hypothetical protein